MIKIPCAKDCPNRSAMCHAECYKYALYKKEWDSEREMVRKKKQADGEMISFSIESSKRIREGAHSLENKHRRK